MSRKTQKRSSTKKRVGGTHKQSSLRKHSKQSTRKHGIASRRLAFKGIVSHRRKRPFASSHMPMSEVVGTMAYSMPGYENAMMRHDSARAIHDRKKIASEKRIKQEARNDREFERLMEEARKKNEENAEVNAEIERMMMKQQRKEHKKSMKAMMRQFEGL